MIGAKRAYISGLAIFVCASALCGFATSTAFLIIARLLQGIGAAVLSAELAHAADAILPGEIQEGETLVVSTSARGS